MLVYVTIGVSQLLKKLYVCMYVLKEAILICYIYIQLKGSGELKKTGELSGRAKDSRDYDPSADDFGSLISALYSAYHTMLCDELIVLAVTIIVMIVFLKGF